MFRNAFRLILVFVVAVFVRQVIAMIARAFSGMANETASSTPGQRQQVSGELKKDPVCGTFVAVATSVKRTVDGQVVHFCSAACRDKYRAA